MKDKKINIQPLGDRILVKETISEEKITKTASGIILPDSTNKNKGSKQGKVIAVGSGKYIDGKRIALEVKVGDTVLFQWGDEVTVDGEEYVLISESSLLAIIK